MGIHFHMNSPKCNRKIRVDPYFIQNDKILGYFYNMNMPYLSITYLMPTLPFLVIYILTCRLNFQKMKHKTMYKYRTQSYDKRDPSFSDND